MLTLHYSDNWNGALCNDSFAFVRPVTDNLYMGAEVQVTVKTYFLGYAKITAVKQIRFAEITDHMAFCIIGHNAAYLRSVLRKMYGTVYDNDAWCFGIAHYFERNISTMAELYERRWNHVKEKCKRYHDGQVFDEVDFSKDPKSHWQGEENYAL